MKLIRNWAQVVWNYEFKYSRQYSLLIILLLVIFIGFGYVFVEVLLMGHPGGTSLSLFDVRTLNFEKERILDIKFTHVWLIFALICLVFRFTIIVLSYKKSKEVYNHLFVAKNFLTYLSAFSIAFLFNIMFLFLLSKFLQLLGVNLEKGVHFFAFIAGKYIDFIEKYVPTLINMHIPALAIFITLILSALPGYFVHWLTHTSRFFWLVFHRAHHCPEYLHPIAAPPAYAFEFFMIIPKTMVAAIISKLIFTEPLVMEMSLILSYRILLRNI